MQRRAQLFSTTIFAGLLVVVVGAGFTWACTGPTFGTPSTPDDPPAPAPDPVTPAPASTTVAPTTAPAASPSTALSTSGSGATSGARSKSNVGTPTTGTRRVAPQAPAQNRIATRQFAQRADGATAGTTRSAGRAVFASPAAKSKAPRSSSKVRSAPSARSASGDLWAGFEPNARSSVFAAAASSVEHGTGTPTTAALALLGLGLVGLLGSATVLGLRRRKAEARTTGRRNSK